MNRLYFIKCVMSLGSNSYAFEFFKCIFRLADAFSPFNFRFSLFVTAPQVCSWFKIYHWYTLTWYFFFSNISRYESIFVLFNFWARCSTITTIPNSLIIPNTISTICVSVSLSFVNASIEKLCFSTTWHLIFTTNEYFKDIYRIRSISNVSWAYSPYIPII